MKRRTAYLLVGGAVVGTAVVAIVSGAPRTKAQPAPFPGGMRPPMRRMIQRAQARAAQSRIPFFASTQPLANDPDASAVKVDSLGQYGRRRAEFSQRLHALQLAHKDARPIADQYSTSAFPVWEAQSGTDRPLQYGQWRWVDEYGRNFGEGVGGGFGLGTVVTIAQFVLPMVPGIGTAGSMALAGSIAVAQGKSAQDVAMAMGRGALPPYAQIAFDVGVAVASGEKVDAAAQKALIAQLEEKQPGAVQAYAQGQALAKSA